MAELCRARPVVVAAIATILTANIAIVSADWARAAARVQPTTTHSTTHRRIAWRARVLFAKADTPFATPTVFSVRADGTDLSPSAHAPTTTKSSVATNPQGETLLLAGRGTFRALSWSHDGTRLAAVRVGRDADDVWVFTLATGAAVPITHGEPVTALFCGRTASVRPRALHPLWSPDDHQIAFLSNADHLATLGGTFDVAVSTPDGATTLTAYRARGDMCERADGATHQIRPLEYVSLVGWVKSANMAA